MHCHTDFREKVERGAFINVEALHQCFDGSPADDEAPSKALHIPTDDDGVELRLPEDGAPEPIPHRITVNPPRTCEGNSHRLDLIPPAAHDCDERAFDNPDSQCRETLHQRQQVSHRAIPRSPSHEPVGVTTPFGHVSKRNAMSMPPGRLFEHAQFTK